MERCCCSIAAPVSTIVGRFADVATAAELAKRLDPVLKAQSAASGEAESPLRAIMPSNDLAPILEWLATNAQAFSCRKSTSEWEPHRIAAIFEDLVAGCAGVFERTPADAWVRLFEAPSQAPDVDSFLK